MGGEGAAPGVSAVGAQGARADRETGGAVAAPPHLPALDGLRCLAFLAVFVHHVAPKGAPFGLGAVVDNLRLGVDLFFALSGFLVTWLLLREERRREETEGRARFSVPRFWARRALRIWPLYALALVLFVVVLPRVAGGVLAPAVGSAEHARIVEHHVVPASTFLLNWAVIRHGWPEGPLGPLWSISVEEQFYVLWPLFLLVVPRARRTAAIVAAIAAAVVAKTIVLAGRPHYLDVYVHTFLRADTFLCGALLAVVYARRGPATPPRWTAWAGVAAALAMLPLGTFHLRGPAAATAGYLLLDVAAVAALAWCLVPGSLAGRALAWTPLVRLGQISYGLYVFHVPARDLTDALLARAVPDARPGVHYALRLAVAFGITVAVAALSYRGFERWFLRLKSRFS